MLVIVYILVTMLVLALTLSYLDDTFRF